MLRLVSLVVAILMLAVTAAVETTQGEFVFVEMTIPLVEYCCVTVETSNP